MSLRFYCEYCPASFDQLKNLINHFETCHRPQEVIVPVKTDVSGYAGADSGCEAATIFLGHPSSCLKCPFPKCVFEKQGVGIARAKKFTRNEKIRELATGGMKVEELAARFDVNKRTIQRAIKGDRQ